MIFGVKVTGSQSAKRRLRGWRELCTLSSAQPVVRSIFCEAFNVLFVSVMNSVCISAVKRTDACIS